MNLFKVLMSAEAGTQLQAVLQSGYIGEGPQVAAFEAALRQRLDYPYVLATNSGTSALELAYDLILPRGGEPVNVITTPLTCLAMNLPLHRRGARLIWCDVDPLTGLLDPAALENLLRVGPVPVMVVGCDWGGSTVGNLAVRKLCRQYGVPFVEDAAHAFGALDEEGVMVGRGTADFTAFSFQAIKTLTTGDGGALACMHAPDAEMARLLRWFGLDRRKSESMRCYQQIPVAGGKFQMNDIAATIGLANLPLVDQALDTMREHAAYYDLLFEDSQGMVRPLKRQAGSSCWLYTVRVRDARAFITEMGREGIMCAQVHARNDVQNLLRSSMLVRVPKTLPGMDVLEREMVCIPAGWHITRDQRYVIGQTALQVASQM